MSGGYQVQFIPTLFTELNVTTPNLMLPEAGGMNLVALASSTCSKYDLNPGCYYLCLYEVAMHLFSGGPVPTDYASIIQISGCRTTNKAKRMWDGIQYMVERLRA